MEYVTQITKYPLLLSAWPLVVAVKGKKADATWMLATSAVVGATAGGIAYGFGGLTGINGLAYVPLLLWMAGGGYAFFKAK